MLKLILLLSLSLVAAAGRSQSIADLTEQLALDVQKLSSLKATLQDMYQGYETLKEGYTRIRDIARDNFNLHETFLDAMWVLSPAVSGDPRLTAILNTEYRIVTEYRTAMTRIASTAVFSPEEVTYITSLLSGVLQKSTEAIEELTMVSTDNMLRMTDDQRLAALDRIDTETWEELGILEQVDNTVAMEAARRKKEGNDIQTLKALYGLPN